MTGARLPPWLGTASLCGALGIACARPATTAAPWTYPPVAEDDEAAGPFVPRVHLHLTAGRGAVLRRLSPGDSEWRDACAAPCDGWVPALGSYRVSGAEGEPTVPFTLPGPPGTSVALRVDPDGHVWTTDSAELRAPRAPTGGAMAIWWWLHLTHR